MQNANQSEPDSLRRRAIAALVVVNLLWGISFPAMKATNMIMERHAGEAASGSDAEVPAVATTTIAFQVTSAGFLMTVRFAVALVLLGLFVPRLFQGLTGEQWMMGAWTGLAFAAGFMLQIVALNYIPASRSGFLTSLSVVFTPLLMIALERRLPRRAVLVGALFALLGVAILTGLVKLGGPTGFWLAKGALNQITRGDWLTVAAALIFAVQILLIDIFGRRMPAGRLTPGMFVATLVVGGTVMTGGLASWPEVGSPALWCGLLLKPSFLWLVLLMSLLCTVLAFHWMNKYQPHVSPAHAALIYTLEPIFATGWAMVLPSLMSTAIGLEYLSEKPEWKLVLGGLLVVGGNALALQPEPRRQENSVTDSGVVM